MKTRTLSLGSMLLMKSNTTAFLSSSVTNTTVWSTEDTAWNHQKHNN